MTCFGRNPLLNNRYQLLATSSIYTSDDEKLISYVEFLRFDIFYYEFLEEKTSGVRIQICFFIFF
jgi:hypothetical protein